MSTKITAHGEPSAGAHIFRSKVQVSVAVVQDKCESPFLTRSEPEPGQLWTLEIRLTIVLEVLIQ